MMSETHPSPASSPTPQPQRALDEFISADSPAPTSQENSASLSPEDRADLQLVRRAQQNLPGATAALLTQYQDRLFGVCLRMLGTDRHAHQTAADLCQDAMVKLIQGLHSFDGRSKFSTWAIRVTMNITLSHLRAQKLRRHESLNAVDPHGSNPRTKPGSSSISTHNQGLESRELSGASGVEHHERRSAVAAALGQLDPDDRALLVLRDVHGLEYDRIGEILNVPLGTVKSRLFRARLSLRQQIEKLERPKD